MNRGRADAAVGLLVASVFVGGGALAWQALQQRQTLDEMGGMMGSSMGSIHGTNPLWYVVGTLVVATTIGGVYAVVRTDLPVDDETRSTRISSQPTTSSDDDTVSLDGDVGESGTAVEGLSSQRRLLDLLPDDERRILEPVLDSPGITQIELRDRSDFSKSKVSQTVSDLEKRGLLYRERQGRTYRVYPSDDVADSEH